MAAVMAEPAALHRALFKGGVVQAADIANALVNVGLSVADDQGARQPVLAEAVPTAENGLWTVRPDGQMTLVWKIRSGAAWHDGTPLTAEDLVFTLKLQQDAEFPEFRGAATPFIERYEALDPSTLSTTWKQPYIRANEILSGGANLPKHLLERTYLENKDGFRLLPYWTTEYVGLGPYKLKDWAPGSHILLTANDRFILGPPRIQELEIRFILDPGTLAANILVGVVQTTVGQGLSLEQALSIRDQWRDGKMLVAYGLSMVIYPQFVNPDPPVVLDVRFRRALLQAIDRQAMADTLQAGLVPIAHGYVNPQEAEYPHVQASIVKYEFDPRRAAQGLEELGYTKGPDGLFRDSAGKVLELEVRATTSPDIHTKTLFPVVDYWQRLGLAIHPVVIPIQQATDLEYRTTQPSFEVQRHPFAADTLANLRSDQAPMAQNRFVGQNRARYMNAEYDGLVARYLSTIPWAPRMDVLRQMVHRISDQVIVMGLFYDPNTTLVTNSLANMAAQAPTWNVHQWALS